MTKRKKSKRWWDTWRGPSYRDYIQIKKGTPLSEVVESFRYQLSESKREQIVGKARRIIVPQCGSNGEWYTIWVWEGAHRKRLCEFHLRRAIEWFPSSKGGRVKKWEIV